MYQVKIFLFVAIVGFIATTSYILWPRQAELKLYFTPLHENDTNSINKNLLPTDDYGNILNIKFGFKILNNICNDENSKPLLLILVHSSANNFFRRQLIRNSWGKATENLRIAFLVGQSPIEDINFEIKRESNKNGDIIQGDFQDTYHNITYKHTMGLKYFVYHCPEAKYILKIDDDVIANTPKLEKFLTEELSPYGAKDVLMCTTVVHARTLRSYRSKWRISFDEYPNRYFPTFCRGMAILYSPDVIFKIYKEAQENKKYIKLDDVFYTGLTAESVGFSSHSNIERLMSFEYKAKSSDAVVPNNLSSFLFIGSELNESDIVKVWNALQKETSRQLVDL